ncbi:MAG: isoleucine--tRNA ligase [Bacilli bacterium]|nr:isoleucine--tRNA ligase [Bacilli bacterium]
MELKKTLRMPSGDFPMKAGLSEKEPALVNKWKEEGLYAQSLDNRVNAPCFALHDGPPYANGSMHCGHALNRCLKDFVVRYRNMAGYRTPFVFGWDTHGLPIEVKVAKSGVDRKKTPVTEFRHICEEYAKGQVELQKEQIRRLGCLGDYDHPYLTLQPEFEARQIEAFAAMAEKGLIFKGFKPVYWSWSSESALAEAEVEYHDVTAKTLYVPIRVKDGKGKLPLDASFVIWTTTPWTLPSNQGVTLNPAFDYGLFDTEKGKLVFLSSLKENLQAQFGLTKCEEIASFKGQELEGIVCEQPIYPEKDSLVMLAGFVSDDAGTGCVHTDSDHGLDDFNVCAKYGIKPQGLVDEKGVYRTFEGDALNGVFYETVNDMVVDRLTSEGRVLSRVDIVHSYPHDWRTKKPVIFRATPQWFCSISPIREQLLEAIKNVEWVPAWGEAKMVNMIKDRADWCISRQRVWGVPLPIIYNEDGSPILEKEVFDHIASLVREHGSNVWFQREAKDLLPEGYSNPASPNGGFTKETDIMDVWFDSGSSWNGVMKERGLGYPCDLYLEGNDQYRGWFNSSLILSLAVTGVPAFKTVVTHGFVMDENWQKMSKSSGNGIDPNKIISEFGADILRLWAGSVDYQADARLGQTTIQTAADNYRKIRNTFKFLLGNLSDYQEGEQEYSLLDRYVLARLHEVVKSSNEAYAHYDFRAVVDKITLFMSGDLSSLYLDYAKDILYCDGSSSPRRKAIVSVIHELAWKLCLLLNPILPFTMEEVYHHLPDAKKTSPQLEDMPKASDLDAGLLSSFDAFKALRDVALKCLEEKRAEGVIGRSTEASISLSVSNKELYKQLQNVDEELLSKFFMVSSISLSEGDEDACEASVYEAPLCPRCRLKVASLVSFVDVEVCPRCAKALEGFHE